MLSRSKLALCLIAALALAGLLNAMVPPHPLHEHIPSGFEPTRLEVPGLGSLREVETHRTLPNNILVLRVQFSDVKFISTPQYPDNLAHDEVFFDRWMLHLGDFFADASHGAYQLSYTLHPNVFTLSKPLAHYGHDVADTTDAGLKDFTRELIQMADPEIDFSQYGGVIVFHAGAGQESDINGERQDEIWSTFLTRRRLQLWFDEDNDAYQGYPVDGTYLTNIVIVPEHEYQDYFPGEGEENAEVYLFSIYGVLAHQFGHILGLPSLYDNDSSNGASQGIGNWGLMGTGIWNASGYVPAQVSAWCRTFLGWETPITVTETTENLSISHFLNHMPVNDRVYKIPISDREYFLVENRQQNPDGSLNPYNNLPSYSFVLLPPGEQDYYENFPELPFFNFMENRYKGSEWDFMLPGLGGPVPAGMPVPVDGSGLLIWHIDENVIAQNFTANFDYNTINAYSQHKGIDLEEADGIQHLDISAADQYKYGSPYDSFRAGNNDYFGKQLHNGILSLPTAESYYGGVPVEIHDISASGNNMTFSVRFGWRLSTGFRGENNINACAVDFDGDGNTELVYPQPDGQIHIWKDELPLPEYPICGQPMEHTYVWTGSEFYFPMQEENQARLYRLDSAGSEYIHTFEDMSWATHPLSTGESLYMALNSNLPGQRGTLFSHNPETSEVQTLREFEYPILANMAWFRDRLYIPSRQEGMFCVWKLDPNNPMFAECLLLDVPLDSTLVAVFVAPLRPQNPSSQGEVIVQCLNSIYVFDSDKNILPGFPYVHDMRSTAPLSIEDWDKNGTLDLIISSDRGVAVIDYSGSRMSPASLNLAASDSLAFSSGVLAVDIDHDGKKELLGSFGFNQLNCWDNSFRPKPGYPVSFGQRNRNLPLIAAGSDGLVYAWLASDNGFIYRQALPEAVMADLQSGWTAEFGSLLRQASRDGNNFPNQYQTTELFVPGEFYIYPNPLKSIHEQKLTLNVMTSRDTALEVKIFDINGSLIFRQSSTAKAWLRNRNVINLPADRLRSGVYICVVSGDRDSRSIKFAVEK